MNFQKIKLSMFFLFCFGLANAQDDLMNELDSGIKVKEVTSSAFKGLQVANMQSTKLPTKNEWYFIVSHRFGDLTDGLDNFFGLDQAYTKFGGIYGVTNWLSVGASRHTYEKTYELTAKYRLANQMVDGFPVTIVGYNTMDINTKLDKDEYPALKGSDRMAYSSQLLFSRKFSEIFSAQLNTIYVHKNLYETTLERKDNFLVGSGGRLKISKRVSVNLDYAARLNAHECSVYHNPLTLGIDIDTGGHIFQMVLSNNQLMNDTAYYTNTTGTTSGKGIFFGFNMYRVF